MAAKPHPDPHPDRAVLEKIGDDILIAEGVPPHCVKAWKYRGVPWKERGKIARIAAAKLIPLPSSFLEERPTIARETTVAAPKRAARSQTFPQAAPKAA